MAQEPEVPGVSDERAGRVANAAHDIGGFIRAQREAAQVSLRQLAALAGVSNPYLSQIERGLRNPSAEVLTQIAKGLRMSSEVLYVRAGFLEQRAHSPVRDALLADTEISERQKQVLLDIYESFRRENGGNDIGGDVSEAATEAAAGGAGVSGVAGPSEGSVPGGSRRDNEVPHHATDGTTEVPPRQESETP
ncbi:helix-turn-helix domain-containing protein [Nocardia vermiculata]|uniref:helix-turn-helix domain-containing protein n=1 Tax=Nocardia vermiculata TaxID=257274 RepID=UPI000831631A|nr:helix-turn-helix transcriptional regulator [Nocardia vermiculata]